MPIKLAVFVSGRGSNLEAILGAITAGTLDARVQLVLSNKAAVGALEIADSYAVKTAVVENKGLTRSEHEEQILQALQPYSLDYIVLAGYMRVLSAEFLSHFKNSDGLFRVINIHPSLLPQFPGKSAYEEAFLAGVKESGITVHLVDEKVDHGPILAQKRFPRLDGDNLETFKARGLAIEHQLYPQVLQQIAQRGLSKLTTEFVPS